MVKDYISTPFGTGRLLKEYSISLRKSLGQNFLVDTNVAKKILKVSKVEPGDVILEVGSGIGNMTQLLLEKSKKIICIEIDRLLIRAFRDTFSDKIGKEIILITGDALKIDYASLSDEYGINKMISNLPYKIAAPLILKVLMEARNIENLFLTIQKDVAERMVALPGDKNYSSFTLKSKFLAETSVCFQISRNCFSPRPFVDSVMVKVERKKNLFCSNDMDKIRSFFDFINDCFSHRRKKLVNSFMKSNNRFPGKLELFKEILPEIGRDINVRAEELSLEDYIFLYKRLNV